MRTQPRVTDNEIKSLMDFEALLKLKDKTIREQGKRRTLRAALTGIACLLMIPAALYILPEQQDKDPAARQVSAPLPSFPADTIRADRGREANESIVKKDPTATVHKQPDAASAVVETAKVKPDPSREPVTAEAVYVQAEPVDGYPSLYEYFSKNLVYPPPAAKDSVGGIVNVVFVIDAAGKAADIVVDDSLGPLFDREAIRLIQNMPPWKPATYNGKPVRTRISLPITFELQKMPNH